MTHLATTAQPATAPQPHVRRDRSRRRTVIAVTAAYLAAAAFRIALSATRVGPLVVGDEIGYLAHARWLAGGPGILMQGTYYYSGSSLFMAPAFWITDNAVTAYQVVLVIQALISAAVLPLLYAFCREIGASSARSLGAAIVGSTIVDAVFWSSYALSESLLAALTVAWVWLTARVIRHGRSRAGLVSAGTLGLVYGLLAAAHSRGLILVGIGALVGVSFIRWAGWRNVLLCTGVGAVSVAGALWLNVATMHANYPTHACAQQDVAPPGPADEGDTDECTDADEDQAAGVRCRQEPVHQAERPGADEPRATAPVADDPGGEPHPRDGECCKQRLRQGVGRPEDSVDDGRPDDRGTEAARTTGADLTAERVEQRQDSRRDDRLPGCA